MAEVVNILTQQIGADFVSVCMKLVFGNIFIGDFARSFYGNKTGAVKLRCRAS